MRRLFTLLVLSTALIHGSAYSAPGSAAALFERDWEWQLAHQPEYATMLGEQRLNDRLADVSPAGASAARNHAQAMLDEARALERSELTPEETLSLDLFIFNQERALALRAFNPGTGYSLTAWDGLHLRLPRLIAQMPFASEADYRQYIARLNALPAHVDGLIALLRAELQANWSAPKTSVAAVPGLLRALRAQRHDGALGAPLQRLPATLDAELRAQLLAAGKAALDDSVAPALRKLEDFMRNDYLPAARESLAASSLPGGPDYYAWLARDASGSEFTPAELHALGRQEVARIRSAMVATIARTGFRGTLAQFFTFARTDKRLFAADPEQLLARYRRSIARVNTALPTLFATIPTAPLGVKPLGQGGSASQIAAYYEAGTPQRSAALVINTARFASLPLWEVDTLALHEALPGHHLQIAHAAALQDLPPFRRYGWNDVYGEGWASYAESLGPQLGLLRDPFSYFGYLNEDLFHAARLVIDTGIHALGWSRQQALDYLNDNSANSAQDNAVEIERYIAQPGQALSYKSGQLRFLALRLQAQAALGARFDVRHFHEALLARGALPLPLLQRIMGKWLAEQLQPAAAAPLAPVPAAATPATLQALPD